MASEIKIGIPMRTNEPIGTQTETSNKLFDNWYGRMNTLISELRMQINTIEVKSRNLYTDMNKEVTVPTPLGEPEFCPTSFYDCLMKTERDLVFLCNKIIEIETNLNKII